MKNAFVDAVLDNGQWWRVGHQVFAWGESESMSISDVLSPYDVREFGQTEIRDIREPIPAVLYSFPVNDHKFSIVATSHARANRYADRGQEFYPYSRFDDLGLVRKEEDPDKEWELAFRYERNLNGSDFSVVAARQPAHGFGDRRARKIRPHGDGHRPIQRRRHPAPGNLFCDIPFWCASGHFGDNPAHLPQEGSILASGSPDPSR
jgi:hypothetical protein